MPERDVLDVFNASLGMVGVQQAASANEQTANADICRMFYKSAFNWTLIEVPWVDAHKKARLAQSDDDDPSQSDGYLYDKPSDFQRLWEGPGSITPMDAYEEGSYIRSSYPPELPVSYLRSMSLDEVSESFIDILQLQLAAYIKPRFDKGQVGANALSMRTIDAMIDHRVNRAKVIEKNRGRRRPRQPDVTTIGRDPFVRPDLIARGSGFYTG